MPSIQVLPGTSAHGVSSGWASIASAFELACVGGRGGAALAIAVDGRLVVDLQVGYSDPVDRTRWGADTAAVVFGAGRGVMALLAARLVDAGILDLDRRIADYWPEFALKGKRDITVRQALAHRTGIVALDIDVDEDTVLDWTAMTCLVAGQRQLPASRTERPDRMETYGWIAGEILRRASGAELNELIRLAAPDGEADVWFGLPESEEPRVARLVLDPGATRMHASARCGWSAAVGEYPTSAVSCCGTHSAWRGRGRGYDSARLHRAILPSSGGIATARSLALVYSAAVVDTAGRVPLSDETLDAVLRPESADRRPAWVRTPRPLWSAAGFRLPVGRSEMVSRDSFGHGGHGGPLAFGDRRRRVGFAFVTNDLHIGDERVARIVSLLRAKLAGSS